MGKAGKTGIIDYGMGNLRSVYKAIESAGGEPVLVTGPDGIIECDRLILPGVGGFKDAVRNLKSQNLWVAIEEFIKSGKPFLGVCLGMQLLFEKSFEFGEHRGFGIFKGKVLRFQEKSLKVPHMGWNKVLSKKKSKILNHLMEGEFFYFVHSYYCEAEDEKDILLETEYGVVFTSGVERDNVFAFQFHPEKSQKAGLKILENFLKI